MVIEYGVDRGIGCNGVERFVGLMSVKGCFDVRDIFECGELLKSQRMVSNRRFNCGEIGVG
ncbi:MAG: hypothetical protein ACETWM_06495 [Candidatus Lokiarchaeia archaeon]